MNLFGGKGTTVFLKELIKNGLFSLRISDWNRLRVFNLFYFLNDLGPSVQPMKDSLINEVYLLTMGGQLRCLGFIFRAGSFGSQGAIL